MIPYAQSYTSTITGRVPKLVECEGCQKQYVYFLVRTATGEGTSFLFLDNDGAKQRAEQSARADLEARLARSCDPVPCPRCGWFQQHMFKKAKAAHKAWMFTAGLAAILVAIPLAIVAGIAQGAMAQNPSGGAYIVFHGALTLAIGGVVLGPILLVWHYLQVARFDPNDAPVEDRIEDGMDRALTLEQFAAMLARQQAAEGRPEEPPAAAGTS